MMLLSRTLLLTFIFLSFSVTVINSEEVHAPVSWGELIDKITILQIKSEKISDKSKLSNVIKELNCLYAIFNKYIGNRSDVGKLMKKLKKINERMWALEDAVRLKEQIKDFNEEFVSIARNVYKTNDHRCFVKRKINILLGSDLVEEKSYDLAVAEQTPCCID